MSATRVLHPRGRIQRHAVRAQRGIVMWVALGVLIVMTLAGLAMLRQMSGGLSIAGNLTFKESATALADLGTENARAWLTANSASLNDTAPSAGYHATWSDPTGAAPALDPSQWSDWSTAPSASDLATGNTVKWVIHRLCALEAVDANTPGQHCVSDNLRAPGRGLPASPFTGLIAPYFRITTQVTGPRNTVSYIQVIVAT